jgi:Zn-dependent protease
MNETLFQALTLIIPLVFAIVFHEVAHGYVAKLLGDPTARDAGRLTLNPLRHVDPIGTVVLPGILALAKAPVFGWAKPVPVNKFRLNNPRRDMMLVAAAGPGSNLAMAGVAAVLLGLLSGSSGGGPSVLETSPFIAANLVNFLTINIFLALFNLLPIPPFDGSHIVEGLLPRELAKAYGGLQRYGFALVIVLLIVIPWLIPSFTPVSWILMPPFEWLTGQYLSLAAGVAGR